MKALDFLKKSAPPLLGFGLIYASFLGISASEKQAIWHSIKTANIFWITVSLLLGALAHLSRAYRWNYLLEPLGYRPKLLLSFRAVMIGYFINLGLPRSGEMARAVTLSKTPNAPSFQALFGTIITERIVDLIMLCCCVGVTFLSNTTIFLTYFKDKEASWLLWIGMVLATVFVYFGGRYFLKTVKHPWILKIKSLFKEVISAMLSIFKIKSTSAFVAHTLFIWIAYVGMFAVIKYSIHPMPDISWPAIALGFIAGSFAMSASSGGIGAFPIAVAAAFALYDIETSIGLAYGWIMWTAQTLMNILVGGGALLFESITQKNTKSE